MSSFFFHFDLIPLPSNKTSIDCLMAIISKYTPFRIIGVIQAFFFSANDMKIRKQQTIKKNDQNTILVQSSAKAIHFLLFFNHWNCSAYSPKSDSQNKSLSNWIICAESDEKKRRKKKTEKKISALPSSFTCKTHIVSVSLNRIDSCICYFT